MSDDAHQPEAPANVQRSPQHERIRERARQLWVSAGQPSDRDEEFWHKAESEIQAELVQSGGQSQGTAPLPPPGGPTITPPEPEQPLPPPGGPTNPPATTQPATPPPPGGPSNPLGQAQQPQQPIPPTPGQTPKG